MRPDNRNYQNQSFTRPTVTPDGGRRLITSVDPPAVIDSQLASVRQPIEAPHQYITLPVAESAAPVAAPVPRRTFEPPVPVVRPEMKATRKPFGRVATSLSAAAVLGVLLIVGGVASLGSGSSYQAVKLSGRVVAIANPTLAGEQLQTSCYTAQIPTNYKVITSSGCSVQVGLKVNPAKTNSTLMLSASTVASSVSLKDAQAYLTDQLLQQNTKSKLRNVNVTNIKVGGLPAIQMTYQMDDSPVRAIAYVTDLPAQYDQSGHKIGSFGVNGPYQDVVAQGAFDSLVSSLQFTK